MADAIVRNTLPAPGGEALDGALARLGYTSFRPGQREAIETLIERRRLLLVAPTGGGKSLIYQLPATVLPGTTLVISPLVALMVDQVQALEARGVSATFLASTLDGAEILALQQIVRKVPAPDHVVRYAMQFTRLTRREKGDVPDFVTDYVSWGAGPRASQYLVLGAKARAALHGRYAATCDDVRSVALPVLRHRIMTNFNAEAEGLRPTPLVAGVLGKHTGHLLRRLVVAAEGVWQTGVRIARDEAVGDG